MSTSEPKSGALTVRPIAYFRSPLKTKFGIPKQSGLAQNLKGEIVFTPEWRDSETLRGIEGFDYIWLIWGFSANKHDVKGSTVRPPVLGGNQRMGLWATRSPFRPNRLGLSSVRIESVSTSHAEGPIIKVCGADLMDNTPIYDIKPYIAYADAHPEARSGFTDISKVKRLQVDIPKEIGTLFDTDSQASLIEILSLDPRPQYHNDTDRIYGVEFGDYDVHFKVVDDTVYVLSADKRLQ